MTPTLTYCGNVHPAEDLDAWLRTLGAYSAKVAAGRNRPFGLGAWWTAATARALAHDAGARARAAEELAAHGLEVATLNAFPFAGFHDAVVGTRVYEPSWADEERVQFTRDVAAAATALSRPGTVVPISTLPLGFERAGHEPLDRRKCARNLVRVASAFADLEARTGVRAVLALEPEPMCVLETVAATVDFLEQWVLREGAWATVAERVLRAHLGVCVDLCHLAVVREDPLVAARLLAEKGIAAAKVQVSSCLELRDGKALDLLLAFDEPRYLHQTVAENGRRALHLGEVARSRAEFAAAGRLRTHFHMPVFWDDAGPLGSTRAEFVRALRGWPGPLPLLEVETYTWEVLPSAAPARRDLVQGLRDELAFVAGLFSA